MELVSVIVPAYQVERHLACCLDSLLAQTYPVLEILLVDDGSTDGTGALCDAYAAQHENVCVIHQPNRGVCAARNAGLEACKGTYVTFVDGDDWLEPNGIASMVERMERDGLDTCVAECYYKDEDRLERATGAFSGKPVLTGREAVALHLRYGMVAALWLVMFRRDVAGEERLDEELRTLEDWEFLLRLFSHGNVIGSLGEAWYHYRTVSGSASKSPLNESKLTALRIPEKARAFLEARGYSEFRELGEGLEAIFLNHLMVVAANSGWENEAVRQRMRQVARSSLRATLGNGSVRKRQKLYCLLIAIHPELFVWAYGRKRRR